MLVFKKIFSDFYVRGLRHNMCRYVQDSLSGRDVDLFDVPLSKDAEPLDSSVRDNG